MTAEHGPARGTPVRSPAMLAARTGLSPDDGGAVGAPRPPDRPADLAGPAGRERDGSPAVALVTGEAGVGKTRLLQELIGALPPPAPSCSPAQAEPGSLGRPYELVAVAARRPAAAPATIRSAPCVDAIDGRHRRARRALVVFEDLHWADAESVAVFERLGRRPAAGRCWSSAPYRPDELTRRLPAGEMLERLERRHFVHQLHLDRLRRAEVGAFLASVYGTVPPSGTVIDTLPRPHRRQPVLPRGDPRTSPATSTRPSSIRQPLPWSLAELVQRQLDGLSPDERRARGGGRRPRPPGRVRPPGRR